MNGAIERQVGILARDGWCVLGGAVEAGLIAGIEQELKPRFEETPLCQGAFYGDRTRRFGSLLTRASGIERLVMHPLVLGLVEQMLLRAVCAQSHPGNRDSSRRAAAASSP